MDTAVGYLPGATKPVTIHILARREVQMLYWLKKGLDYKQIAGKMMVGRKYVSRTIQEIYGRVGLRGAVALAAVVQVPEIQRILEEEPALRGQSVFFIWPHPEGCSCGNHWCSERKLDGCEP